MQVVELDELDNACLGNYNFYLDQYKGTRQQVMGGVDNKLSKKE